MEEFSVDIAALIPAPALLEVKVHQTPEQIPSCVTFPVETDSLERVFLGDRCIFEAFVAMGINLDFYWHFTDDSSTYNSGADCYQQSDCLSNTVVSEPLYLPPYSLSLPLVKINIEVEVECDKGINRKRFCGKTHFI